MDYTGKQLLILFAVEHAILLFVLIRYGGPALKKLYAMLKENGDKADQVLANQSVLAHNDKVVKETLDKISGDLPV